jgi:DNA-binding response OmpR family regulator
MKRITKNLRQINNARLILVSCDDQLIIQVKDILNNKIKELVIISSIKELNEAILSEQYDIAVVDYSSFEQDLTESEDLVNSGLPKIIISNGYEDKSVVTAMEISAHTSISKPLNKDDFSLALMMSLNQNKRSDKIEFREGFYFDKYREQMFDKNNKIVEFTRLEYGLITLLISKPDDIVDYDMIHKEVWKGKKMSIFTMRNVINKIRQKTYYEIILNRSNKGYTIDNINLV